MRLFQVLIILFISTTLSAQTTINYVLNNANIHIQPAPVTSGFIPATNYATITKPLLAEAFAINAQAGVNSNSIHPGSGNVNDVFFGGDLPATGSGLGAVALPVLTKQTFDLSDFPVLLKCNFYNSVNVPLYNESYLQIVPANYQYFGSTTTNIPNVAQREGILFGGNSLLVRTFNHLSTTQNSIVQTYSGNFGSNGTWYTMEVLLDIVNGNLVAKYFKVNNQTVFTNVSFGAQTWQNNYRLGFVADDLAESLEITTNYSTLTADFQINNTTICEGSCVNLTDLSNCATCNNYQWTFSGANQTGSTQQNPTNICFQNAGTYPISLTVSDGTNSQTVTKNITVLPNPTVNLGNNMTLCDGQSLTLDATTPNATYLWSDNSTNAILSVNSSGNYAVTVTVGNCTANDMITITSETLPIVDLGVDTIICSGGNLLLTPTITNATSFQWQNGSTGNTFSINQTGTYFLTASNICGSVSDSINVGFYNNILSVDLGNDTSFCDTEILNLNVNNIDATEYLWQDGSINSDYVITQAGTYFVTISNPCESVSDTINVALINSQLSLELGSDTVLCTGGILLLNATNSTAINYLWQDGSTAATFEVTQSGTYFVTVQDSCNIISDTINVIITDNSPTLDLGNNIETCIGETTTLDATTTDANTYVWNNGSTNPILEINTGGQYTVTATNNCGSSQDSILVNFIDCNCYVIVPNAFSPNGNQNLTFYPMTEGVCSFTSYKLIIFNRLGNKVFETNDIMMQWDGVYKNEAQPQDTYTWIIDYELDSGFKDILKGSVLLVR